MQERVQRRTSELIPGQTKREVMSFCVARMPGGTNHEESQTQPAAKEEEPTDAVNQLMCHIVEGHLNPSRE